MSKSVNIARVLILSLLFGVACKQGGVFRPSIESAKPLEIWEKGKSFQTVIDKIKRQKENMQTPAYEKWLAENVIGRQLSITLNSALPLIVTQCDYIDKSKCTAKYRISIRFGGLFDPSITLHVDDEKAITLPKKGKLAFRGIIHRFDSTISDWSFDIWPANFEIIP